MQDGYIHQASPFADEISGAIGAYRVEFVPRQVSCLCVLALPSLSYKTTILSPSLGPRKK